MFARLAAETQIFLADLLLAGNFSADAPGVRAGSSGRLPGGGSTVAPVSAIDEFLNAQAKNAPASTVAGPKGMVDAAVEQDTAIDKFLAGYGGSFTQQQVAGAQAGQTQMAGTFRSWYSGQNLDGQSNGWNTDFQAATQKQTDDAYERGNVFDIFTQPNATGVVTWDGAKGRDGQSLTWGDVIVDGAKVANVYKDFDRHTANVMMGEYTIQTGARKAELNNSGDIPKAWDEELSRIRTDNAQKAEVAPRAKLFKEAVEKEVTEDPDTWEIVAGGAVGTAALAAPVGAMIAGPFGAAVAGVGGLVVGGVGAWLNSDSLSYQLARSQEQEKMAAAEGAGLQAKLNMVASNTMSIGMSPFANLLQGSYDVLEGEGPGKGAVGGAFLERNEVGDRKAGLAWQAADLVALVGNSALQFASPLGRLAYQAQMTTQISAGVLGLVPSQGTWDPVLLRQNNIWTRDEFNPQTGAFEQKFDVGNALAGIGNVGIDVVQLGMVSGLSRQADRLAAQNRAATGVEGAVVRPFHERPWERLNLSGPQREALKNGAQIETRSGYKFVITPGGEVVGKARGTIAMLAPSEGLQALSAKMLARRDAARRQGAVTSEELYQHAANLAIGQRGLQAMLLNAVGEGQEEAIQAFLEPWSQDHTVDAETVIRSALSGAASGFGMTAGTRIGRPNQDLQMFELGRAAHASQTRGQELTYEAWQSLDNLQKRTLVKSASGLARSLVEGAYKKIEADRINGTIGGVVEAARLEDHYRDEAEAGLKTGTDATDQASPIVMHESYTFRPEAIATSHDQLLQNQQDRTRGASIQLEKLGEEIKKVELAAAAAPSDQVLIDRLTEKRDSHVELAEVLAASQQLEATLALNVDAIRDAFSRKDTASAELLIDGLNSMLESMFDMTADTYDLAKDGVLVSTPIDDAAQLAFAKASSRLATRDPADSEASWQVLMPQVNKLWAFRGANGVYGVSQIILKAIRGDYDGDKMRELQQVIQSDKDWTNIRAGGHILGVAAMPEIGSTKFEAQLAVKVMQHWDDSTNDVLRGAAHKVLEDIETDLKIRYHSPRIGINVVPLEVITEVSQAVKTALKGGGDVREVVLKLMSQRAGNALMELGRGQSWSPGQPKLSNEYFWMANMVTGRMDDFQRAYATYTPKKGKTTPDHVVVQAAQTSTNARTATPRRNATEGSTAIAELPGSNNFRIFQKLHYTLWETTDKYVGFGKDASNSIYMQLVQHYEELSQGEIKQRLERQAKSPSDQIIGDVMRWLEQSASDPDELDRLGLSELGDMALMANVGVAQMLWASDENGEMHLKYTGKEVSLAQHLLYLSLEKFKREYRQVWEDNADLRAAYNNLYSLTKPQTQGDESSFPGNAEMAFVKIFDSTRLYDIVGTSAVSLGVHRTVGQVFRELRNLSVEERKSQKFALHGGEYADAEKGFTIPFGTKELEARSVTAYKSVVDSLFSAADSSLSMNLTGKDKGKVHGRDADKSDRRGKAVRETYDAVKALLQRIEPRTSYTAADVSRIANEHREFGTELMKVIPQSAMPWVFKRQEENGDVVFASWFYEVWLQPSAKQAEMSFLRNLIMDTWNAKVRNLDIENLARSEGSVEKKIAFDSLDSRFHQLMFRLASNSVIQEGVETQDQNLDLWSLKHFMTKFDEASSVEEFMKWLNTESGLVVDGAPLLAWMDDVAEFDPVRSGGGWASSKLTTPTLMEHVNSLKATAQKMIGDIKESEARAKADLQTARAIEKWQKHLDEPNNQNLEANPDDEIIYGRFTELLKASSKRRMANGPRSMLQHTAHLVHGMYAPAHAKGAIAEQMAANAALEAMDNAFGYLTTSERALGDLTAHNEESVAQSPQMILRDGGRTMNRYGAQVEWEMDSVRAMLPLMLDSSKHSMMRAVLFDTVIELDGDNIPRRKFLMGSTLDEVMSTNTVKDLFADGKNPNLVQSMKTLVKLEQKLRGTRKHGIEQKVTEIVLARTTALDHTADFEEIQSMTVQAYMDLASSLQVMAQTKKLPGQDDPVHEAYRKLKEVAMVKAISEAYGIDPLIMGGQLAKLQPVIVEMLIDPHDARISRIVDQLEDTSLTATTRSQIEASLAAEMKVREAMLVKIKRMFDLNVTDSVVAQFHYSTEADDASKHARQTELMKYVYEHGELMQAAGPALVTVQAIKNHFGATPREQKLEPFILPEKEWEELSNVIISMEIQHLLTVGPASKPPPPYPAALKPGEVGLDTSKYWDHSFSYMFDFMAEDATDGILQAARELAVEGGFTMSSIGEEEVLNKVGNTLLREGSLGRWTPSVVIQSIESYEMLQGASAMPSISMYGLLQRRWGAVMLATTRQFEADTVADSTVELTSRDLNWMETGQFHDVTVTHDNGKTYQRPLAQMNNRFAQELSFTYGSATTPVDLMTRFNVARTWLPAAGAGPASQFKEVNITRLREEIELALQEMDPDADADVLRQRMADVKVTMKFVNPDSQPATAEHANSLWHEGTVYYSDGDTGDNLVKAFFYGVGGMNPRGQQAALDTRKLGLAGIEDYQRTPFAKVRQIENDNMGTDFGRMLALKTKELMDTAISDGKPIDIHFYNAAYKIMKLKHWVDGVDRATGEKVRLSAEQVIAWQMTNPETDPTKKGPSKDFFAEGPLEGAKLWIPSDQVLADMMGDIGLGGVRGRMLKDEITDDLTKIPQYESAWSERMESKFSVEVTPTDLASTDVARQAFVQDLRVSSFVTPQEKMRFQRRVENMSYRLSRALEDRRDAQRRPTFDPVANGLKNRNTVEGWVSAHDLQVNMPEELKYLSMENGDIQLRTLMALEQYMVEQKGRAANAGSSYWIFQETGTSSAEEGRLIKGDLTAGLSLVPGEVVFLDTAAYEFMDPQEARDLAMKRVDFFVNRGVALMIGSSRGPNHLISELQNLTRQRHGYQRFMNNNNILVPDVFDESSFQNVAAARSRLTAPSAVQIAKQRLTMLLTDHQVEENTMWKPVRPGRRTKFESIQAVFDLLPIDVNAQFNSPNTRDEALKVQGWLEGLGTDGVAMLRQESLRHLHDKEDPTKLKKGVTQEQFDKEEVDFNTKWDRLMLEMPNRVQHNTTAPLVGEEHIGTGDFIPLINSNTGELMLYRHGYTYPKQDSYRRQLNSQVLGSSGPRGIVMYSGERESSATTHEGTVVSINPSPGRGFRMELEIPVQMLGSKIVFEHNGMKYLLTNLPGDIQIPESALFGDIEIDGFASLADSISKEATQGLVTSFQQAFTVFGIDFTEDIRKFFGEKNTADAISLLKKIARFSSTMSVEEVYQFQSLLAGQDAYFTAISGLLPTLSASGVDISKWSTKLEDSTAEAAIARAMIIYLTSPGADVEAILGSTGFYVDNPSLAGAESQMMPELFTRAFDLAAPDSAIKKELSDRINDKRNKTPGESWHLDVNSWELEGVPRNGVALRGMLQYGEAHVSEDNPLLNLAAQERKDKQSATYHQGLMNRIGTGGLTLTKPKLFSRLTATRQQDLPEASEAGSLWRDLTFVDPQTYGPGSRWQRRTPTEHKSYANSIQRMVQYRHALDFDDKVFEKDRPAIETAITTVVNRLGLRPSQEDLVHYWIRQVLYHPVEGSDQEAFSGDMAPGDVLGALRTIMGNLDRGYYPTYDGTGPSFLAYDDLAVLFHAYRRGDSTWASWRKEGDPGSELSRDGAIGDWIAIAFGQAINESVEFDPIYSLDMSGFMNTYQTVLRNSGQFMDITFDKALQGRLLDPKTNELMSVTLDLHEENRLTQQVIMATANLEYEDLMQGAATSDDPLSRATATAWRARRLKARARWRARHQVRPVKVQSSRDFVRNGTELINRDPDMHSLQRIVIALRHGNAMLNPGLYAMMLPEQGFRMLLSEASNALTGESTTRVASGAQRGVDALASKLSGGRVNLEFAQYNKAQVKNLNTLFEEMGADGAFRSLIMKDMVWHKENDSPGKVVRAFEKYAAFGNKWQDPTWGTSQKSLARHYVEAIIRIIESEPTKYAMTTDSVISYLTTDPAYFAKKHKDLHLMASNFVIDFRSLKNTPWSLAMKRMYEPWASSGSGTKRFFGTLIKLQAMYATYNMNVLTTMTGMQGYTAMASVFLDAQKTPGSLMSLWWKARNGEPVTDEDYRTFDMSSTIEGVTIANAFIRGGVTQTGLFMLGMAAGGALSGEDDEAKRRRKLAQAQNAPLIMDPRRLEADFRNKDALFLDWLPPQLGGAFFRVSGKDDSQDGRQVAQMSWLLKPFLSPILGMERFFMTGDFSYVTAGFSDAVSTLPLFSKHTWDDAVRTASELESLAADEQAVGTPTATKNAMYLLTSAVGVYENMLLENMFVNSLYAGFDTYDRDPTRIVLRDSDGDIQKTIEDNARPNDVALSEFPKDDGTVGTGYTKRDPNSARMAAYTENHFTAAAVMSLFKPIHKQEFLRGDMPVRIRSIDLPELSDDEAKTAVILATLNGQKAKGTLERQLSLDEVTATLKDQYLKTKNWDAYNNLDALAMQFYKSPQNPVAAPLSVIGKDGQEVLTKSGQAALFKGLMAGTITLDSPEMRGVAITKDMRKELEKDFYVDITRQGIDLGLTVKQAENRAKRLMMGPLDDPTIIGFRDILWDKRIPWEANLKYKQLNTTYVMGPDGFPWATGYKRGGAPGAGGFASLFGGLKRPTIGMSDAITQDGRMNSVDKVNGIDTGMRGLVPFNETELIPTDWEQTQKIIDAIKADQPGGGFSGYEPNSRGGGNFGGGGRGFTRFPSRGGSFNRGSGFASKGFSPNIYWSRQPTLPRGTNVFGNTTKNLFWNNANIRRTTIRRERYQSSRGRLMQWQ